MSTNQKIDPQTADIYHRRWNSFLAMWYQADQRWIRLVGHNSVKVHPELMDELSINTLQGLLHRLKEFGSQHFKFFFDGFVGNTDYAFENVDQCAKLNRQFEWLQSDYSIGEFVLSEIIDRVAFDLQVIDQAIDQRFMAVTTTNWTKANWKVQGVDQDLSINDTINTADELAIGAMLLFKTSLNLDRFATAITYQRSSPTLRVIPYADVALIGLPISTLGNDEDILAIPHEVGHFLYWNGKKQQNGMTLTLREWLQQKLSADLLDYPWLEEVVADVVSCLIGGPITTFSLMQLLLRAVGKAFLYNDGEHPIPAIRPYVCLRVLDKMVVTPGQITNAKVLRDSWKAVLALRNIVLTNAEVASDEYNGCDPQKIKLSELLVEDGKLFRLVDELCGLIDVDKEQISLLWYNAELDYSKGTTEFVNRVREKAQSSLRANIMSNFSDSKKHINPAIEIEDHDTFWSELINKLFEGSNSIEGNLSVLQQSLDSPPLAGGMLPKLIPAKEWLTVFEARGWTTGGAGPSNFKDIV